MGVTITFTWIFGLLFLVCNLCCGVWGLALWRKLTCVEHALAIASDEQRAKRLHRVCVKYARRFREARWCFFFSLDVVIVLGFILVRFGALTW